MICSPLSRQVKNKNLLLEGSIFMSNRSFILQNNSFADNVNPDVMYSILLRLKV